MKIIRKGTIPGTQTYRATCQHCQTLFEFAESEARHSYDQRDGNALVVDCPLCKSPVWFYPALRANGVQQ